MLIIECESQANNEREIKKFNFSFDKGDAPIFIREGRYDNVGRYPFIGKSFRFVESNSTSART
ncbi:hypothetical protein K732_21434 [Salmonella enterica subsp. enterica serovar Saintpaul str. S-70]|nr:hypothetical protein K732_21434 [Salmonella enterica subsp. enterica serovar Saintpaul str. S-70]